MILLKTSSGHVVSMEAEQQLNLHRNN